MIVHECEQGSEEWARLRLGIPTTSMFATIMAKGKDGGVSLTRKTYMMKIAGEVITGEPAENYQNAHMERGRAMEAEARERYAFDRDEDPQLVGFITADRVGASPDSLIRENGLLEIKTKMAHLLIECLLKGDFPPEHRAQVQGQLWVAEREWCDLAIYWPKLPLMVVRAHRDETYIKALADGVDQFNTELDAVVRRVRAYSQAEAA